MRLVLLGAPGSGKGTQGVGLAERFGVAYIATGELLRSLAATDSDLGLEVGPYLDRGDLVPDDLVLAVVRRALDSGAAATGYLLDGFPRTRSQADAIDSIAPPDAVVYLALPDTVARRRLARRAEAGRSDDVRVQSVERRLALFHEQTEPLLELYRERGVLTTVDATDPPDIVTERIVRLLAPTAG